MQTIDPANWRTSSKIEALMEELSKVKSTNPNAKSLVFSQFVSYLDLVEWRLSIAGNRHIKKLSMDFIIIIIFYQEIYLIYSYYYSYCSFCYSV